MADLLTCKEFLVAHQTCSSCHSVSVAKSLLGFILATILPRVSGSNPPENEPLSRLDPFASPRIRPCSFVSKLTVWLVSEKSQQRIQTAVSVTNAIMQSVPSSPQKSVPMETVQQRFANLSTLYFRLIEVHLQPNNTAQRSSSYSPAVAFFLQGVHC